MATYQNLITQSMYDKQLDSGKGTLLHLCDDVVQQEVSSCYESSMYMGGNRNERVRLILWVSRAGKRGDDFFLHTYGAGESYLGGT